MLILIAFVAKGVLGVEFDHENAAFVACSHLCTMQHTRNCALCDLGTASCCGTRFSGSWHSSSVHCAKNSVGFYSKYNVACFVYN